MWLRDHLSQVGAVDSWERGQKKGKRKARGGRKGGRE